MAAPTDLENEDIQAAVSPVAPPPPADQGGTASAEALPTTGALQPIPGAAPGVPRGTSGQPLAPVNPVPAVIPRPETAMPVTAAGAGDAQYWRDFAQTYGNLPLDQVQRAYKMASQFILGQELQRRIKGGEKIENLMPELAARGLLSSGAEMSGIAKLMPPRATSFAEVPGVPGVRFATDPSGHGHVVTPPKPAPGVTLTEAPEGPTFKGEPAAVAAAKKQYEAAKPPPAPASPNVWQRLLGPRTPAPKPPIKYHKGIAKKDLIVGQTYSDKNGKVFTWDGTQFLPAQ